MTSVKSNPSSETFPSATQQTVQDWLAFLTRKNDAQKHIRFCSNRITAFLRTLPKDKQQNLSHVDRPDVEQFISEAQRRGGQPQSINRSVSTILVFFDFLIEQGRIDHNPVLRRHRRVEPAPRPRALSQEEVNRWLTALGDTMDKATFLLMLRSGACPTESPQEGAVERYVRVIHPPPPLAGQRVRWVRQAGPPTSQERQWVIELLDHPHAALPLSRAVLDDAIPPPRRGHHLLGRSLGKRDHSPSSGSNGAESDDNSARGGIVS